MDALVVGAGPAGLYLAYLLTRQDPGHRIRVVERNPPDATFGFGVVFSERALDFLRDDDEDTWRLLTPAMERWSDLALNLHGERIVIDGVGFAAIGRLALLQLLRRRLESVGVRPECGVELTRDADLEGADLVVAADGANSFVRGTRDFGTHTELLHNRFVWYGTPQRFDTLSQTFVATAHGAMNAHHYRYAADMSTFIVECDGATWRAAGFGAMDEEATRRHLEQVFAAALGGRPLVSNRSLWRRFPKVHNERWSVGNRVLVGDALRTAHFSIGSGTRLAFEGAITLARAIGAHGDLRDALQAYEHARRPVVDKLVAAADRSAAWYERFAEHMRLAPHDFALAYLQRSGRVDPARLRAQSPRFAASLDGRG
jgi:2-polyprenyl-6-methoxyphenol hydroxylase-like FAD-dependent oxidoreductase